MSDTNSIETSYSRTHNTSTPVPSVNCDLFSQEEYNLILKVIEKDRELRKFEELRIRYNLWIFFLAQYLRYKIFTLIKTFKSRLTQAIQENGYANSFYEKHCRVCSSSFIFYFRKAFECEICKFKICKKCSIDSHFDYYICLTCYKKQ